MNKDEEKAALAAHVRRWETYGPELERLRAEAFRAQSEEEHLRAIADVLAGPIEWFLQGSRPDSGLVEQQRIFGKLCRS
ncbi:MAG: hypothetical protein FGM15_10215 [Chthoniobacterales bacterium]|nr:hypothetical protein [Chthoniobacterales bacterium]